MKTLRNKRRLGRNFFVKQGRKGGLLTKKKHGVRHYKAIASKKKRL